MTKEHKIICAILASSIVGGIVVGLWTVQTWINQKRDECVLYGVSLEVCEKIITIDKK